MLEQAKIPGYRIVRELGRGGVGRVFLAVQESLGREVALKLLSPQFVADAVVTERFLREGRIAARLTDRHIISVYDVGVHAGQPYLAMEYVTGGAIATDAPIAASEALEIAREIALALDHAHSEGVIHRDLKPENILCRKDGSYALTDFGIACALCADDTSNPTLTREGTTVGTPYYMSPEQLQAKPLDGRSDLYSLGVVLYQLLTGEVPYRGTDDVPVGMQHVHAPLPQLPARLGRYQPLINALMAKSPAQRPASGAEVATMIEAMLTGPRVAAVTTVMHAVSPARRRRWILAAGLIVILAGIGGYAALSQRSAPVSAPANAIQVEGASADNAPLPVERSVAVLPLVNAGGAAEQQFFADGISESLIAALSRFENVKVVGRISSFRFRGSNEDSQSIGAKLGVAYLVSGSVQHVGDAVRIGVELSSAADGHTVWIEHYDRPYKDLFVLQDEITHAVAGALRAKLRSPNEAVNQSDRPPSGNIDAYNAYLQGLKYWHDEDFRKAAEYMTQAVQLDPDYAMAWAHLSGSQSTVAMFENEPPEVARELMREARIAVGKALQLAPGLGAAHAARSYLHFYNFDHQGALAECRRAVQLAPDDGTILNGCGHVLAGIGKLGEAIRLREHLLSIEPLYNVNEFKYAELLMATGRLDEAAKYLRIAEGLSPPNSSPAYPSMHIAIARGDVKAAQDIARSHPPASRDINLAIAMQISPDRAAADAALASVLASESLVNTSPYLIAQAYALRGDHEKTLEWLERTPAYDLLFMLADPLILRLRDDPGLIALCKKAGLPPPSESDAWSIDRIRMENAGGTK